MLRGGGGGPQPPTPPPDSLPAPGTVPGSRECPAVSVDARAPAPCPPQSTQPRARPRPQSSASVPTSKSRGAPGRGWAERCVWRTLPESRRPEAGHRSAYRLDAELADGVVHEDHAVLHAHPDAPVRPAALVRPVLVALFLHGTSEGEQQVSGCRSPPRPLTTRASPTPAPGSWVPEPRRSTEKCVLLNGDAGATPLVEGCLEPAGAWGSF